MHAGLTTVSSIFPEWLRLSGSLPLLTLAGCVQVAAPPAELAAQAAALHAPEQLVERTPAPLTQAELHMAAVAWKYFENNARSNGLVNATHGFAAAGMGEVAAYLGGMMAAYEIGIISRAAFDTRTAALLDTLLHLEFFRDELPNRKYNTQTQAKVNYANQPADAGFSALDLGRLLIWLKIYKERYPRHGQAINEFVLRWDFSRVIDGAGALFAARKQEDDFVYVREGHLGGEEYAATGFRLWGFETAEAARVEPYRIVTIHGIDIPYDHRDSQRFVSYNYVTTDSYALTQIEVGWERAEGPGSQIYAGFARRIFAAQAARYYQDGILAARSEHSVDRKPYFVYDTVFGNGFEWNTLDAQERHVPAFAALVSRSAFAMWAVWDMPYSQVLLDAVGSLYNPDKGFYEGVYENGTGFIDVFTARTNGIILESLLYKAQGELLRFGPARPDLWEKTRRECPPEAQQRSQCERAK